MGRLFKGAPPQIVKPALPVGGGGDFERRQLGMWHTCRVTQAGWQGGSCTWGSMAPGGDCGPNLSLLEALKNTCGSVAAKVFQGLQQTV